MKELITGGNAALASSGNVKIVIDWQSAPCELDVVCFALNASGTVPSDHWFLFFNQAQSPAGAIQYSATQANRTEFQVYLDQLPDSIEKCVFAAALDGEGNFTQVANASLQLKTAKDELIYRIREPFPGKALIFGELYRHSGRWKIRAVGQGFNGGLQALAETHGVNIAEDADHPPVPAAPQPPQPPTDRPRRDPAPEPAPPVPPQRSRWKLKLLLILLVIGFVTGVGAFYYPAVRLKATAYWTDLKHRLLPDESVSDPNQVGQTGKRPTSSTGTTAYIAPSCELSSEEVFTRYHALGENYLRIRDIVNDSNNQRARIKRILRAPDFNCPDKFRELNKSEIKRLEELPIAGWIQETTRLNICAGILNSTIEEKLSSENRAAIIQRLLQDADRTRNLESDLTNIARDLAYFQNKVIRLIDAYNTNLEACTL